MPHERHFRLFACLQMCPSISIQNFFNHLLAVVFIAFITKFTVSSLVLSKSWLLEIFMVKLGWLAGSNDQTTSEARKPSTHICRPHFSHSTPIHPTLVKLITHKMPHLTVASAKCHCFATKRSVFHLKTREIFSNKGHAVINHSLTVLLLSLLSVLPVLDFKNKNSSSLSHDLFPKFAPPF